MLDLARGPSFIGVGELFQANLAYLMVSRHLV